MRIAIIGRSEYLYQTMQLLNDLGYRIPLIVTAKETLEYKHKATDFAEFAQQINATFLHQPKLKIQDISELPCTIEGLDIAVSINYSGIIPKDVINVFRLGILNLHAGDLPRYRGNAPVAWAMLNHESQVGLCVHRMIGGELDSGDIVCREYFPLHLNTRIQEVFQWIGGRAPEMMLNAVRNLDFDPNYVLQKQSKDAKSALRGYPRIPLDARIDWSRSNVDILKLINVSSEPFSGAFCVHNEDQLTIWRADIVEDDERYCAVPGQISDVGNDGSVVVITGKGKIRLSEVSLAGSRTVAAGIIKSTRTRLR